MSVQEVQTLQHTNTTKKQEHQDLHDSSVAAMLRGMQREVNTGHPFERRLHIDYSTNNHPTQLHAANDVVCCFMAVLSWVKATRPRIMKNSGAVSSRNSIKGGSPASLPRPRGRHRSHGGTSRL